ncbi:cytochrome P450 [Streptosporangium amethystogenes]|uniref:cytochrome P450 n=1 Tax=Streptosporangium amethystogenes TaxID=2002 RepID=UPI00068CF36D|nr:cytochrome P450 [Streptosporangium amethystogenes]
MSIDASAQTLRRVKTIPVHRVLPDFARDPVNALADIGGQVGGELVRLSLGPFRPYLVTHPEHVQQVLKGDWTNYQREGMFWRPLRRLLGASILGEGRPWESSRKALQPLFTTRYVASIADRLAETITARMDELDEYAGKGQPVNAAEEMAGIVNDAVVKVLFGDKISRADGERLAPAYHTAAGSITFRLLMPFMPYSVRVPGDRAFMKAVKTIDDVVFPVIRKARAEPGDGSDVISALCGLRGDDTEGAGDRQIRDDLVSVYGAASESTATTLTWLWPQLDAHPEVAARLYEEIDRVVGPGPVKPGHVAELRYTRMVLQELLRLYPAGWIFPRMAMRDGEVDGVRIKAGSQMLISPYATHRLERFWDRPLEFDPERFAPEEQPRRHKYAYFPFGGGPHQCLGQHLFYVEAPLLLGAILSRFRMRVRTEGPFIPAPAASLRPRKDIELDVVRVGHVTGGTR